MISVRTRLSVAAVIFIAAAAPALAGPAFLKFGGVKGESSDDKHKDQIEILSWSWGGNASGEKGGTEDINIGVGELQEAPARANDRLRTAGPVNGAATSDPQQNGEWIADVERPAERTTSDPQEGGEVARTKPKLSEIPVIKVTDKSTPVMTSDPQEGGEATPRDPASGLATGKRVHKPMTMTKGNVVVTMPEGVCVAGAHYPLVTLTSGDQAYEMQDVTVASCTPVTTAKGRKDKAKLDYMVVKMETVLISG